MPTPLPGDERLDQSAGHSAGRSPGRGDGEPDEKVERRWAAWALVLSIGFVAAVRIHRLDLAIERDEGEYAYGAQLILARAFSYADFHTMKLPGVHAAYAFFLLCFGQTREAIHAGVLIVDVASMWLLFRLGRRLLGSLAGASAAAAYGTLALGKSVFGLYAHAEHFAVLFVLAGALVLHGARADNTARLRPWAFGGLLLGIACLMKQQALPLAGLGLFGIAAAEVGATRSSARRMLSRLAAFSLGGAAAYGIVVAIFLAAGSLSSFWFWTFTCARAYVTRVTLSQGLEYLRTSAWGLLSEAPLLWLSAVAGSAALLAVRGSRRVAVTLAVFAALSFLATCPGLYFRNHYMIFVLPPACLLAAAGLAQIARRLARSLGSRRRAIPVHALHCGLLALACGSAAFAGRNHLFLQEPAEVAHTTFPGNPFHESLELARELDRRSSAEDTLAILGSEPQILFYAGRRSATGFIYTYFLMEESPAGAGMQQELVAELESRRPRFVVYVNVPSSWGRRPGSSDFVFRWAARWCQERYRKIGVVEVLANGSRYWWDEKVSDAKPASECFLIVYERRD